jgi:hypothetical protein
MFARLVLFDGVQLLFGPLAYTSGHVKAEIQKRDELWVDTRFSSIQNLYSKSNRLDLAVLCHSLFFPKSFIFSFPSAFLHRTSLSSNFSSSPFLSSFYNSNSISFHHSSSAHMATFKDVGVAGQGLAENALNERIDKLFACGIGEYVNLPQLVVVGDQSSGKSSVLEGLTKLNFPRDSGLCTRFATQIVFRREPGLTKREISASIIPSSDLGTDQSQALGGWRASGLQSLNPQGFSQMMQQVVEITQLSFY